MANSPKHVRMYSPPATILARCTPEEGSSPTRRHRYCGLHWGWGGGGKGDQTHCTAQVPYIHVLTINTCITHTYIHIQFIHTHMHTNEWTLTYTQNNSLAKVGAVVRERLTSPHLTTHLLLSRTRSILLELVWWLCVWFFHWNYCWVDSPLCWPPGRGSGVGVGVVGWWWQGEPLHTDTSQHWHYAALAISTSNQAHKHTWCTFLHSNRWRLWQFTWDDWFVITHLLHCGSGDQTVFSLGQSLSK